MGDILSILSGEAFKKKDYSASGVKLLQIANVSFGKVIWEQQNFLPEEFLAKYPELVLEKGDIVMALNRPILNDLLKIACLKEDDAPAVLYQRVARFNLILNELREYFFNYTGSPLFLQLIRDNLQGSDQPYINTSTLPGFPIPLPPLNEQKRIVDTIAQLRERSQKARSALSAIPELCNKFRQSVLAAAFRGDLTADWHEQNPDVEPASVLLERIRQEDGHSYKELPGRDLPETWKWVRFQDVADIQSNLVDPSRYPNSPHIAPNHIVSGKGELLEFTTVSVDKVTSSKHLFESGQIIYSKIRPYLAKAVLISFSGLCSADMYPIKSLINSDFLHQWMICPEFTELASGQQGRTVLPKINQAALNQLAVPVPPLSEQVEIIRQLQSYFSFIATVTGQIERATCESDFLDRSILAKAFRGELVEQDPSDEPASVLLDRIRAEREQQAQEKAKKPGAKGQGKKKAESP